MGFVSCIDDRPIDHRVEIIKTFQEVSPLRNLIRRGISAVFCTDFSGATENRARNQKRQKYFGYSLEPYLARDKVIFVIAKTIALPVGVVAVNQKFNFSQTCVQARETFCDKSVSGSFIGHNFTRVTTFRCGIFRVGPVYV
jgi:hypothetical protein